MMSHFNAASVVLELDLVLNGVRIVVGKGCVQIFSNQSSNKQESTE
jgi:hypothetical protein